jgi:hypothetical protein
LGRPSGCFLGLRDRLRAWCLALWPAARQPQMTSDQAMDFCRRKVLKLKENAELVTAVSCLPAPAACAGLASLHAGCSWRRGACGCCALACRFGGVCLPGAVSAKRTCPAAAGCQPLGVATPSAPSHGARLTWHARCPGLLLQNLQEKRRALMQINSLLQQKVAAGQQ